MTVVVPPEVESSIHAAVRSGHFASVDEAMTEAARLLLQQIHQRQTLPATSPEAAASAHKPIWEVVEELRKSVPPEEFAKLPKDGAE
jgi:Arc/MetJ-type ribon-helix-helix transcriptional regulator